ncbi:MAG: DUF6884 domain-containing protein [archaeon]
MKQVVLISCVSKKKNKPAPAYELYDSTLFDKNLKYAKILNPDLIFILSAQYGVVPLDERIKPYDKTLNKMKKSERKQWANKVINQLKEYADLKNDKFIFLAGKKYRKYLLPEIEKYKIPLKGKRIGEQLSYLSEKIEIGQKCSELHKLIKNKARFTFPFDSNEIPDNGIYILFEKGEYGHADERIVRVGTHRGDRELPSR